MKTKQEKRNIEIEINWLTEKESGREGKRPEKIIIQVFLPFVKNVVF